MSHHPTPIASSRRVLALDFIRAYHYEHGCSPSYEEIAAALNTKKPRVHAIVKALVDRGDVIRARNSRRGLRLPRLLENIPTVDLERELARRRSVEAALPALPIAVVYERVVDKGVTFSELTLLAKLDDVP